MINKFFKSFKSDGFFFTVLKILNYPKKYIDRKIFEKNVLNANDIESKFTWIFENNYWGNSESFSGDGSTLTYTSNLRKQLPMLIKKFSIESIFDAPCGDFNWMKLLLPLIKIKYTGADIVYDLIKSHNINYSSDDIKFIHLNILIDSYPNCDLMLCRDCLFHLSYDDINKVLDNFLKSRAKYLLTTNHINKDNFINRDIKTGDFRRIDLFSSPFNFPGDVLYRIEDWMSPEPEREMCLWSREQIASSVANRSPRKIDIFND